jgi:hypothetical protein
MSRFSPRVPRGAALGHDHILAADEIGGQCRQSIITALPKAVFDRQILSLDEASFTQSLVESGEKRCSPRAGHTATEDADHRHRLLLRAEGARHRHRAAQQEEQLAASHSMPSLFALVIIYA